MPTGRFVRLPIDPWPRASLAERTAVGSVLALLLVVPCIAAALLAVTAALVAQHVYRSYDLGLSLRALVDRRARLWSRGVAILWAGRR